MFPVTGAARFAPRLRAGLVGVPAARRKVALGEPPVPRTALQLAFLAAAGLAPL
ncbi:hypothetical protein GCM10027168_74170 [Streptomyces capparidis]